MTEIERMRATTKISEATRKVEETAVQVVKKKSARTELTSKVSDSAAELSDYLLARARKAG